jgi:hypothetical protein
VLVEHGLEQVSVERDAGLGLKIKVSLADVNEVMLSSVPQSIDSLQREGLLITKEPDLRCG